MGVQESGNKSGNKSGNNEGNNSGGGMNVNSDFGCNVWWYIPETSVDVVKAQTLLKKHGFEAQDIPTPSRHKEVSMASYSFADRRSKENRRIVEKVKDTPNEVVYGILEREQEGEQAAFDQKTTVRLDKSTGSVTVEGKLQEAVMKALPDYEGKIDASDIRTFLGNVIDMCYGVAKRPSGGIYFVPAKFAGVIDQAQGVIKEFNGAARIYVERVMDGTQERQNVWESVEADVESRVAEAVAALGRIERRASAVKGQGHNIQKAEELMKVYTSLLGEEAKFEAVAEKIEAAVKAVSEKMFEVQPDSARNTTAEIESFPTQGITKVPKAVKTPKAPKELSTTRNSMSSKGGPNMVEAAIQVLQKAGKPMSYREIMDEAVKQGLYESVCSAPYASFYSGIVKAIQKGEKRFVKVGKGIFSVAA